MALHIQLWLGDCLERLKKLDDASVDAVIGDPPYELNFMSKGWDDTGIAFAPELYAELLRVLKPGGPLKVFSATRTYHRVVQAMRKVGFLDTHLRAWTYGSGFPKSTNISKSLDRMAGAERKVIGTKKGVGGENLNDIVHGKKVRQTADKGGKGVGAYGSGARQIAIDIPVTEASTEEAKLWEGYGTALKPAWEPLIIGRKAG
jgi:hypothetical protein